MCVIYAIIVSNYFKRNRYNNIIVYFVQTLFFIILFVMHVCGSHCKNESLYCTLNCPNTHTKNFWKLEDFRAGGIVLSVFFHPPGGWSAMEHNG